MNIFNLKNLVAISALVLVGSGALACPPQDRDATGACPAIGGGGNHDRDHGRGHPGGGNHPGYPEDQQPGVIGGIGQPGGHRPDPSPYDPYPPHKPPHRPPHRPPPPPYYPPQPPPPPYYPPQPPPPYYGERVEQISLYQNIYSFGQIDLDNLLSLYRFNGYRVVSVEVEAQSLNSGYYSRPARLSLRVNHFVQSTAYTSSYSQRHYLPAGHRQIGWDLNDLTLEVEGDALISRVLVRLSR